MTAAHLWEVFGLFVIPIGGGIPAGVVVAQKYGIDWRWMTLLYFISDIALAIVFEPLMLLFIHKSETSPKLMHIRQAFSKAMQQTTARYGINPRPFSLIMIAFGSDPMTGRTVAKGAGHGFVTGWALAITGDMFFFWAILVSTLCLNNILGDGTVTAIVITVLVLFFPTIVQKIKDKFKKA